ncbi:unnamed protein product [Urochloa humidicola]
MNLLDGIQRTNKYQFVFGCTYHGIEKRRSRRPQGRSRAGTICEKEEGRHREGRGGGATSSEEKEGALSALRKKLECRCREGRRGGSAGLDEEDGSRRTCGRRAPLTQRRKRATASLEEEEGCCRTCGRRRAPLTRGRKRVAAGLEEEERERGSAAAAGECSRGKDGSSFSQPWRISSLLLMEGWRNSSSSTLPSPRRRPLRRSRLAVLLHLVHGGARACPMRRRIRGAPATRKRSRCEEEEEEPLAKRNWETRGRWSSSGGDRRRSSGGGSRGRMEEEKRTIRSNTEG